MFVLKPSTRIHLEKKASKEVTMEAGTMQPTTGPRSTMNKTHTDAAHPKSYYT